VAEVQKASDTALQALMRRIEDLASKLDESHGKVKALESKASEPAPPPPAASAPAAAAAAPAQPVTINVQVDAKTGEVKKSISLKYDDQGKPIGAEVTPKE
jgi:uncharacterized protein YggE